MQLTAVILVLLLIAVVVVVVEMCSETSIANFEKKYPPISDEEFLSRCGEGVNAEVALKARRIVANQTQIDYERITPDMTFLDLYE